MVSLFNKLSLLTGKHGIQKILTTLEDICFVEATNAEHLKKNNNLANWWRRVGSQIGKIKFR